MAHIKKVKRTSITFDVIIIGGCITGITTALLLQKKGYKVMLVDYNEVGFFTSGSYVTHINGFYDSVYFDILKKLDNGRYDLFKRAVKETENFLMNTVKEYNIQCDLQKADGYILAKTKEEIVEMERWNSITGNGHSTVKSLPVQLNSKKSESVGMGFLVNNVKYLNALKNEFLKIDGQIQECARVLKIEGDAVKTVYSTRGKFKGKKIVYTPQTSRIVNVKPYKLFPYIYYSVYAELENYDVTPCFSYDLHNPSHRYIVTSDGFSSVVISGCDHKNVKGKVRTKYFDELKNLLLKNFNVKDAIATWSYVYYMNDDMLPVIGAVPQQKNAYIAAGYKPDGMVVAFIATEILVSLITEGESVYADLFSK